MASPRPTPAAPFVQAWRSSSSRVETYRVLSTPMPLLMLPECSDIISRPRTHRRKALKHGAWQPRYVFFVSKCVPHGLTLRMRPSSLTGLQKKFGACVHACMSFCSCNSFYIFPVPVSSPHVCMYATSAQDQASHSGCHRNTHGDVVLAARLFSRAASVAIV